MRGSCRGPASARPTDRRSPCTPLGIPPPSVALVGQRLVLFFLFLVACAAPAVILLPPLVLLLRLAQRREARREQLVHVRRDDVADRLLGTLDAAQIGDVTLVILRLDRAPTE